MKTIETFSAIFFKLYDTFKLIFSKTEIYYLYITFILLYFYIKIMYIKYRTIVLINIWNRGTYYDRQDNM